MLVHAGHLLARAWAAAMSAVGTTTLGLILLSVAVSVITWLLGALYAWLRQRNTTGGRRTFGHLFASTASSSFVTLAALGLIVLVTWSVFVIRTIYFDHIDLVRIHAADLKGVERLQRDLEFHRHNVSTTDPVFPNLIYMLQAFRIFRNAIGRESCVLNVTAPAESAAMASTIAQLSIQASNCSTFGPFPSDLDPDQKTIALNGIVPNAIEFHAARDDKAALRLFEELGNQIGMVRSYDLPAYPKYQAPPGGYAHTIWLQWGTNVKWNSELRFRQ
jgi:hypothetical protein